MSEEWTVVTRKSRRRKKTDVSASVDDGELRDDFADTLSFARAFFRKLNHPRIGLDRPAAAATTTAVLGLGSLTGFKRWSCPLLQLAFALECISCTDYVFYDPAFVEADRTALSDFGVVSDLDVLESQNNASIFYMPHCPIQMYESLLVALCERGGGKIVLVGNALQLYRDGLYMHKARDEIPHLYESLCKSDEGLCRGGRFKVSYFDTGFLKLNLHEMDKAFTPRNTPSKDSLTAAMGDLVVARLEVSLT